MNNFLRRLTAAVSAAVMSAGVLLCAPLANAAEDAEEGYTVVFDCWGDDISFSKAADPDDFLSYSTDRSYIFIPKGSLVREGYNFQGWTVDGVYGILAGETYNVPEDGINEDGQLVLEPVWTVAGSKDYHNVTYVLDEEVERPKDLKDYKAIENEFISVYAYDISDGKRTVKGWYWGDMLLTSTDHILMPAEDVTFTPRWRQTINFIYTTGDVDRVNGMTEFITERAEGTGWLCDYDGEVYAPLSLFRDIPGVDVTFTAVWTPKNYNVVFRQSNKNSENIKVPGVTDTYITCPEPTITKEGYYLSGWKDENGDIYAPGDQYFIYGKLPGLGIALEGIWTAGSAPETTTTLPKETVSGDANCDGAVKVGDAVLILQAIANKDKYGVSGTDENAITEQGWKNADCCNPGDGVTPKDALAVQMYDANIVTSLPMIESVPESE